MGSPPFNNFFLNPQQQNIVREDQYWGAIGSNAGDYSEQSIDSRGNTVINPPIAIDIMVEVASISSTILDSNGFYKVYKYDPMFGVDSGEIKAEMRMDSDDDYEEGDIVSAIYFSVTGGSPDAADDGFALTAPVGLARGGGSGPNGWQSKVTGIECVNGTLTMTQIDQLFKNGSVTIEYPEYKTDLCVSCTCPPSCTYCTNYNPWQLDDSLATGHWDGDAFPWLFMNPPYPDQIHMDPSVWQFNYQPIVSEGDNLCSWGVCRVDEVVREDDTHVWIVWIWSLQIVTITVGMDTIPIWQLCFDYHDNFEAPTNCGVGPITSIRCCYGEIPFDGCSDGPLVFTGNVYNPYTSAPIGGLCEDLDTYNCTVYPTTITLHRI